MTRYILIAVFTFCIGLGGCKGDIKVACSGPYCAWIKKVCTFVVSNDCGEPYSSVQQCVSELSRIKACKNEKLFLSCLSACAFKNCDHYKYCAHGITLKGNRSKGIDTCKERHCD